MANPRGVRLKPHHQEDIKLKIQSIQIAKRVQDHILGKLELSATQLKAAEILLARTMPTLSAVEQTTIDESAKLTEADLLAQLAALIEQHPDLVQQALAARARNTARALDEQIARAGAGTPGPGVTLVPPAPAPAPLPPLARDAKSA